LDDVNVIRTAFDYFKSIKNLDKFNEIPIPQTEYQNNLKLLDSTPPEQFLKSFAMINKGVEMVELTGKEIFNQFTKWCAENHVQYETTPLKFGIKMNILNVDGITKGRHTRVGETKYYNIEKIMKHYKINNIFDDEDNKEDETKDETRPEPTQTMKRFINGYNVDTSMTTMGKITRNSLDVNIESDDDEQI
jgi:hypothetical protein